ncbi:MtrAB system histidine kinase MtrB [Agrococcus versicolor]|uniref:Sensor histidine kinase MtrB n=1 Tax=Agrococcus versicolor TaxID=501482 RepID=A0ABN3ASH2_9MICO
MEAGVRALPARLAAAWRRSLQLRIVATSVLLSLLAMAVVGGYMSISIGASIFEQRRDEALLESVRATEAAQQVFTDAAGSSTTGELAQLQESALQAAAGFISNPALAAYAMLRTTEQVQSAVDLGDTRVRGFDDTLLTEDLVTAVAASDGTPFYQSVRLATADGTVPGLIVGTVLEVPSAGRYEFYIVHSLEEAQVTLQRMQTTMVIGGVALLALVALVTLVVVRMVVAPVEQAAATSAKLASGRLDERMAVRGDDVLARLGRSFNDMADSISSQITRLAALSNLQQRFVSDVSHELRTPLTTIRLAGDVLYDRRDTLDPVAARTAELLHTQIDRFEGMLIDLLEMSRFDAGAATLEIEPTNVVRLAETEIESVRLLAEERGSAVRLVAPGGHFDAEVDPRRIRRILQNLLGNAIDHGEGRPITVTVDSNADAVAIAVRDLGVGMTEDETGRVFDRFWRADPSRQRRTGGTGLGLAISQEDAVLHGGVLDVWSQRGEGTAFRLTIPRGGAVDAVSPIALPPEDTGAIDIVEGRA